MRQGGCTSWTPTRATTNKRTPPAPASHSVPVQGHHATLHSSGPGAPRRRGIYRCRPKVKLSFRAVKTGDLAGAVEQRNGLGQGWGQGWSPFRGGWLGHPSPHRGELENLGLRHRGGSAFETSSQSQPFPGPTKDGQTLVGADESLLGQGLVLGA